MACLEHNYREFLFGIEDWVHTIADGDRAAYQAKFSGEETRSVWQSLAFGPNYKSAYCQAVCPAGDDVIGPYMADRAAWRREVVVPLLRKEEAIYVRSGTRAEHVALRNSSKRVRYIDFDPADSTPDNFALGLKHRFDTGRATASGTRATIAFHFPAGPTVTVVVAEGRLGLAGSEEITTIGRASNPAAASAVPAAVVRLLGDSYIRLIHATDSRVRPAADPIYDLDGDPSALGALLAVLS